MGKAIIKIDAELKLVNIVTQINFMFESQSKNNDYSTNGLVQDRRPNDIEASQ